MFETKQMYVNMHEQNTNLKCATKTTNYFPKCLPLVLGISQLHVKLNKAK
jgi:hypothetical protein